jgi:uncharacterized protein YdhG (YjbR/CyaY superfamily)
MKKAHTTPQTIDDYLSGLPIDVQAKLQEIRQIVRAAAPDAQEAIKYGIPSFVLNENLLHFAAYAKHIGFYPTPSGIEAFRDELSDYVTAKGSIQFPLNQRLPTGLIKRIVKFRVKEVRAKLTSKERARGKRSSSSS